MTQWKRSSTIVLPLCAAAGILFGLLPRTWIEFRLGIDPDGGSGLFELLLAALPIAIGLGSTLRQIRPYRKHDFIKLPTKWSAGYE
jgi:hypothetical protein